MKLAWRLIYSVLAMIVVVLLLNLYLRVQRERELFRADRLRDHEFIGYTLRAALETIWRSDGLERAQQVILRADLSYPHIVVLLRPLEGAGALSPQPRRAHLFPSDLPLLARGQDLNREREGLASSLYPLRSPEGALYAVEVSESLENENLYLRQSVLRNLLATGVVMALAALGITLLGRRMVGRPLSMLREKTRRIGTGDLGVPLVIEQRDELGELAEELNAMCERLAAAQREVEAQTQAKLEALEQLRHADRLRTVGQLASGLAHELGTPLNVVQGHAQLLQSEAPDPFVQEAASTIVEQTRRMTGLVRQLMDFARRRGPKATTVDAGELVRGTVDLLASLGQRRGVTVSLGTVEPALFVHGDLEQLRQVLSNLVVNGIQASKEGGTVALSCQRVRARNPDSSSAVARACCVLRVQDSGHGIKEEDLARVFDPFFTTKEVGEGTGLGLSVAHGIVQDHSGWISVESKVGVGTSFSVYLPLQSAS